MKIGVIGDFEAERPSHKATNEALIHCADDLDIHLDVLWIPTISLEAGGEGCISKFDGIWCAPGKYRSIKGVLNGIQYARINNYPFLGTCAGFQYTMIEYARNKLGLYDAQHEGDSPNAKNLLITALSCPMDGKTNKVLIWEDSQVYNYYGRHEVMERFTCKYGLNPLYKEEFENNGFKTAGTDENSEARIFELAQNKFFIITLFQPQLSSSPDNPHKLILAYLKSIKET